MCVCNPCTVCILHLGLSATLSEANEIRSSHYGLLEMHRVFDALASEGGETGVQHIHTAVPFSFESNEVFPLWWEVWRNKDGTPTIGQADAHTRTHTRIFAKRKNKNEAISLVSARPENDRLQEPFETNPVTAYLPAHTKATMRTRSRRRRLPHQLLRFWYQFERSLTYIGAERLVSVFFLLDYQAVEWMPCHALTGMKRQDKHL